MYYSTSLVIAITILGINSVFGAHMQIKKSGSEYIFQNKAYKKDGRFIAGFHGRKQGDWDPAVRYAEIVGSHTEFTMSSAKQVGPVTSKKYVLADSELVHEVFCEYNFCPRTTFKIHKVFTSKNGKTLPLTKSYKKYSKTLSINTPNGFGDICGLHEYPIEVACEIANSWGSQYCKSWTASCSKLCDHGYFSIDLDGYNDCESMLCPTGAGACVAENTLFDSNGNCLIPEGCYCKENWYGPRCESQVTCNQEHGTCEEGTCYGNDGDGTCTTCSEFYFGPNCESVVTCFQGTCNEGTCFGTSGNGHCDSCDFDSGYFSEDCFITPCMTNFGVCEAGTCDGRTGNGTCTSCFENRYGLNCEFEVECKSSHCEVGSCQGISGTGECDACDTGDEWPMYGAYCDKAVQCNINKALCTIEGGCLGTNGTGMCDECFQNWYTPTCTQEVPCDVANGDCNIDTCYGITGSGVCDSCSSSFHGEWCRTEVGCDTEIGSCSSETCYGPSGTGNCDTCPPGRSGKYCEICNESCDGFGAVKCSTSDVYACECFDYIFGETCETVTRVSEDDCKKLEEELLSLWQDVIIEKQHDFMTCSSWSLEDLTRMVKCQVRNAERAEYAVLETVLEAVVWCIAGSESYNSAVQSEKGLIRLMIQFLESIDRTTVPYAGRRRLHEVRVWVQELVDVGISYNRKPRESIELIRTMYVDDTNPDVFSLQQSRAFLSSQLYISSICTLPCECGYTRFTRQNLDSDGEVHVGNCQPATSITLNGNQVEMQMAGRLAGYLRCASLGSHGLLGAQTDPAVHKLTSPASFMLSTVECLKYSSSGTDAEVTRTLISIAQNLLEDLPIDSSRYTVFRELETVMYMEKFGHFSNGVTEPIPVPMFGKVNEYLKRIETVRENLERFKAESSTARITDYVEGILADPNSDLSALSSQVGKGMRSIINKMETETQKSVGIAYIELNGIGEDITDTTERIDGAILVFQELQDLLQQDITSLLEHNAALRELIQEENERNSANRIQALYQKRQNTFLGAAIAICEKVKQVVDAVSSRVSIEAVALTPSPGNENDEHHNTTQSNSTKDYPLSWDAEHTLPPRNLRGAREERDLVFSAIVSALFSVATAVMNAINEVKKINIEILDEQASMEGKSIEFRAAMEQITESGKEISHLAKVATFQMLGVFTELSSIGYELDDVKTKTALDDIRAVQAEAGIESFSSSPVTWTVLFNRVETILQYGGLCQPVDFPEDSRLLDETQQQLQHRRLQGVSSFNDVQEPFHRSLLGKGEVDNKKADNEEENEQRRKYFAALRKMYESCSKFKNTFQGFTSYGREIQEQSEDLTRLFRRKLETVRKIDILENSESLVETELEAKLNAKLPHVADDSKRNVFEEVVNYEARNTALAKQGSQLVVTAITTILDLCNQIAYSDPGQYPKLAALCKVPQIGSLSVTEISKIVDVLDNIKRTVENNFQNMETIVFKSGMTSNDILVEVTNVIPDFEQIVQNSFQDPIKFALSGPYIDQASALVLKGGVTALGSRVSQVRGGPYFPFADNVEMSSFGLIFANEDGEPLGPSAGNLHSNDVMMSIDLYGHAVKSKDGVRYSYNLPPYSGMYYSYHLQDENGRCRNGPATSKGFCVGSEQSSFGGVNGREFPRPTPYRQWKVTIVSGEEHLKDAKRVYLVASYTSERDNSMPEYKEPPPEKQIMEVMLGDYKTGGSGWEDPEEIEEDRKSNSNPTFEYSIAVVTMYVILVLSL